MRPAQGDFPAHRMGDIWASQQLDVDVEPRLFLEYGGTSVELKVDDLLPLRRAIGGLLAVFGMRAS